MAVTKLSNSGIKTGVLKYDSMLAGNTAYDPSATWLIQRVAGTGSSATITFSNIPTNYKHLQIRALGKNSSTATFTGLRTCTIQFNSDTGANYAHHRLQGNGSAASAAGTASASNISIVGVANNGTGGTNILGTFIIDILDYRSTSKNKTVRAFSGCDGNTASTNFVTVLTSGLWVSTSAITSLTLTTDSNWSTNSTFALYGITG